MNKENKKYDLVITNGQVLLSNYIGNEEYKHEWIKQDVGIKNNKIVDFGPDLSRNSAETIDATGKLVLPGIIDSQVHFREPGLTHKEDIQSGSLGAVMGGITGFFEMPNTKPATDSFSQLEVKSDIASKTSYANYGFFLGATDSNFKNLNEIEKYNNSPGVKIFMGSSTGNLLVKDDAILEEILKSCHKRIAVHCEDENRLIERFEITKSEDPSDHPNWRDEKVCLNATERIVNIANKYDKSLHCLHITTAQEINFLSQQKQHITVEVTPQHLTLNAPECYDKLGTRAQMNPPIRGVEHQEALWKGIKDRVVNVIGSDHAPHTIEEKNRTYPKSPSGMTGVQTLLPIMLNHVSNKKLSIERLCELVALEPARIFNLKELGGLRLQRPADITIVDMNKKNTIKNSWIESKSGWTPFDGKEVQGWPFATIINGEIIMKEDKLIKKQASGKAYEFKDA